MVGHHGEDQPVAKTNIRSHKLTGFPKQIDINMVGHHGEDQPVAKTNIRPHKLAGFPKQRIQYSLLADLSCKLLQWQCSPGDVGRHGLDQGNPNQRTEHSDYPAEKYRRFSLTP